MDVEQKLEWTQLHLDYRSKFEDTAQRVLQEAGYDVERIIEELTKFTKSMIFTSFLFFKRSFYFLVFKSK